MRRPPPRLAALAVLVVVGLALLALVSSASRGGPYADPLPVASTTGPAPSATPATSSSASDPTPTEAGDLRSSSAIGDLLLTLFALAGAVTVLALLAWAVRHVRLGPARARPGAAGPVAGAGQDLVAASVEQALAQVDQPDAREAIVAAWLLLGAAAAEAGTPARDSETATEYADRVTTELGLPPAPLHRLAELYREARFSDHEVTEQRRGEARTVLLELRADLALHLAGLAAGLSDGRGAPR